MGLFLDDIRGPLKRSGKVFREACTLEISFVTILTELKDLEFLGLCQIFVNGILLSIFVVISKLH